MLRRCLIAPILIWLLTSSCVISPRRGTVSTGGSTGGKLYVATAGSILRFGSALTASGNVAPEAIISGASTQISSPQRILIDVVNDRLFVANQGGASVLIFHPASTVANNAAPSVVLSSTGNMVSPFDLAIDVGANLLYVADGSSILVFGSQSSLNGSVNTPPLRTITFTFTIGGIFLDAANNRLFIVDPADNAVQILPGASTASGSGSLLVSPIVGANTLLNHPNGVLLDPTGRPIVSNLAGSGASITIYPNSIVPAGGNVSPVASLSGSNTLLAGPGHMAINTNAGSGELYVADALTPAILIYSNVGNLTLAQNLTPSRNISGGGTNLNANAVNGIALDTTR
jgi:hypothetical protein